MKNFILKIKETVVVSFFYGKSYKLIHTNLYNKRKEMIMKEKSTNEEVKERIIYNKEKKEEIQNICDKRYNKIYPFLIAFLTILFNFFHIMQNTHVNESNNFKLLVLFVAVLSTTMIIAILEYALVELDVFLITKEIENKNVQIADISYESLKNTFLLILYIFHVVFYSNIYR